jgi:hypothetical protein
MIGLWVSVYYELRGQTLGCSQVHMQRKAQATHSPEETVLPHSIIRLYKQKEIQCLYMEFNAVVANGTSLVYGHITVYCPLAVWATMFADMKTLLQPPYFTDSNNNRSNSNYRKGCSTNWDLASPSFRGRATRCCSQLRWQHADIMWWASTHNAHSHWFVKGCSAAAPVWNMSYMC